MPFKSQDTQRWLNDILHNINLAVHFASGFDLKTFQEDSRTVYAVTRCLEIISEASRRLPDELKARHPDIEWKQMAGAGNVYRHDYENVAARYVVADTEEGPIAVPIDLQEALQQHPAAQTVFERLSYSKKKRFVSWIEHADGEAARSLQVKKIIDLLHQIHQQYPQ